MKYGKVQAKISILPSRRILVLANARPHALLRVCSLAIDKSQEIGKNSLDSQQLRARN